MDVFNDWNMFAVCLLHFLHVTVIYVVQIFNGCVKSFILRVEYLTDVLQVSSFFFFFKCYRCATCRSHTCLLWTITDHTPVLFVGGDGSAHIAAGWWQDRTSPCRCPSREVAGSTAEPLRCPKDDRGRSCSLMVETVLITPHS